MGFLERAIRRGVRDGVSNAVSKALQPTVNRIADQATTAAQQYADEVGKSIKICPSCGEGATADKKFCQKCGTALPEQSVTESAVCGKCGTQNHVGSKFCQSCGEKLTAAVVQEQITANNNAAVMAEWDQYLSHYPKWSCGGSEFNIEEYDPGCFEFRANFNGNHQAARRAVDEYRQILLQNGFRQAGEYPCIEHLYKKENGVCYHVDTGMCFEASPDNPSIAFNIQEPRGGFDYVKPEPKKKTSFMDLFK